MIFAPLVNFSGFRLTPAPVPMLDLPATVSCRRWCPDCSDPDFEVTWWGDRTCWSCLLPVGEPAT